MAKRKNVAVRKSPRVKKQVRYTNQIQKSKSTKKKKRRSRKRMSKTPVPNIVIRFEDILKIRKKRLDFKRGRKSKSINDEDITESIVCESDVSDTQSVISIDDSVSEKSVEHKSVDKMSVVSDESVVATDVTAEVFSEVIVLDDSQSEQSANPAKLESEVIVLDEPQNENTGNSIDNEKVASKRRRLDSSVVFVSDNEQSYTKSASPNKQSSSNSTAHSSTEALVSTTQTKPNISQSYTSTTRPQTRQVCHFDKPAAQTPHFIPLEIRSFDRPLVHNQPVFYDIVNPVQARIPETPRSHFSQVKVGSTLYNVGKVRRTGLRDIIIDGSNVAMGHSQGRYYSVEGLKICIDYFLNRGHKVKAFIPHHRMRRGQSTNPSLLQYLQKKNLLVLTPSRRINGRSYMCYDDRYIVEYATKVEGIIVSGDNYRDLFMENEGFRDTIEKRLLIPTWIDDVIMFPADPLGRYGPTLDEFLRFP